MSAHPIRPTPYARPGLSDPRSTGRGGYKPVDVQAARGHPGETALSAITAFFQRLWGQPILEADVRRESWALGSRHMGEVVQGARAELMEPKITWRRTLLLRAVIAAHAT